MRKGIVVAMLSLMIIPLPVSATPSQDVDKCVDRVMRENAHEIDWRDQRETKKRAEEVCKRLVSMTCEGQDRDSEACRQLLGESRPIR